MCNFWGVFEFSHYGPQLILDIQDPEKDPFEANGAWPVSLYDNETYNTLQRLAPLFHSHISQLRMLQTMLPPPSAPRPPIPFPLT